MSSRTARASPAAPSAAPGGSWLPADPLRSATIAPAPVRFDVRAENDRYRSAQRLIYAMVVIGIIVLLAFGVFIAILGAIRGDWFMRGLGIASGAFGVVMALRTFRDARRRAAWIEVTADGPRFGMADGTTLERRWTDPSLKLALVDYRNSNILGARGLSRVPCVVHGGSIDSGLSAEALKSMRAAALRAGATVIDTTPDAAGRMSLIGTWPEIARPIGEPPPYD